MAPGLCQISGRRMEQGQVSLNKDIGPQGPGLHGLIRRLAPRGALGVVIGVLAVLIAGRAAHARQTLVGTALGIPLALKA